METAVLLFYIVSPLQTMAVCMAKVSVALLLLRIVGFSTWRRWTLYGCIVLSFIIGVTLSITIFLQCSPPRALWNDTVPARCWSTVAKQSILILGSGELFTAPKDAEY